MKKLPLVFSILALLAAGCSSHQQPSSPAPTPVPTSAPSPTAKPNPDATVAWKTYTNPTYGFQFKYPQQDFLYGNFLNASGAVTTEKNDASLMSLNAGMSLVGTPYLTLNVTALAGLPVSRKTVQNNAGDINPIIQQDFVSEKANLDSTPIGGALSDSGDPVFAGIRSKLYEVILPVGSAKADVFVGSESQAANLVFEFVTFDAQGNRIEIEDTNASSILNEQFLASIKAGSPAKLTPVQIESDPSWQQFLLIARTFQLSGGVGSSGH